MRHRALARMKADHLHASQSALRDPAEHDDRLYGYHDDGLTPGTQVVRIAQLEPFVCINGFRALHSQAVPVDPDWDDRVVVDKPDRRDPTLFPVGVSLTPPNNPAQRRQLCLPIS